MVDNVEGECSLRSESSHSKIRELFHELRVHWPSLCFLGFWVLPLIWLLSVGAQILSGKLENPFNLYQVTGLSVITFSMTALIWQLKIFDRLYEQESRKRRKKVEASVP